MRPAFILLLVATSSACGGGSSGRFSDAGAEVDYAAEYREDDVPDMDAVARARDELEAKIQDLENEVSRFGYENWRAVVPDVEYVLEEAEQALQELEDVIQRENVGDRLSTTDLRRRVESLRDEVDGFVDTRRWPEAVDGTEGELDLDSELSDLEAEIRHASEIDEYDPEYEL